MVMATMIINRKYRLYEAREMKKLKDEIIVFSIRDALDVSGEFKSREKLTRYPITGMKAYGT